MTVRVLIVIPAWNEAARLGPVLAAVRARHPDLGVVVVNDGSTDATAAVTRAAGVSVLTHPFNMGYGAALQTGYLYALRHGYEAVIQLDADGQHAVESVQTLLDGIRQGGADVVLGSRFLAPGRYRHPWLRRIGAFAFNRLTSRLIGQPITDSTSGFLALSRAAVTFAAGDHFPYDFPDANALIMFRRAGLRVREVPVRMNPQGGGTSMHRGFRPLYYLFFMAMSLIIIYLRQGPVPTVPPSAADSPEEPAGGAPLCPRP